MGPGAGRHLPTRPGRRVRLCAGCRCRRLSARRRTRSSRQLPGVQQRPRAVVRHRHARRWARHGVPRASPDLFWALRGGKGGFGVVTSVTIDLLDVTHVYGGGVSRSGRRRRRPARLRGLGALAPRVVDHLAGAAPPASLSPALPDVLRGEPVAGTCRFASLDPGAAAERPSTASSGCRGLCSTPSPTCRSGSSGRSTPIPGTRCRSSTARLRWRHSTAAPSTPCSAPPTSRPTNPFASVEIRSLGPATALPAGSAG